MSFKEIKNIKMEYRIPEDEVIESFYIPCLAQAKKYDRAVGFFSSSILLKISKGLCAMAKNNAKIRLLISPRLSQEDYEAIEKGYKNRYQEFINEKFENSFEEYDDEESINRFALLSHLISSRLLDIKVVFLTKNNERAMYHEKLGIMKDYDGNRIAFTGSSNETENGYEENYEAIDVFCSWKSAESFDRIDLKEIAFNSLWDGIDNNTIVLEFPKVIVNKLLKYESKKTCNLLTLDENYQKKIIKMKRVKTDKEPKIKENIVLHDYQEEAIKKWELQNFRGIYSMATGTGKTFAGAGSICRLFEAKKRIFTVIVCPTKILVEQWYEELNENFNIEAIKCYENTNNYLKDLNRAVKKFSQKLTNFICIITTNKTFMLSKIQEPIINNLENVFLLVDEAHNFGADKISSFLEHDYPYRLALSATFERFNDGKGTKKLLDFFGEKCIEYTLKDAIIHNQLSSYKYYPILVTLTDDELDQYIELTKKIKKCSFSMTDDINDLPESVKMLLVKRARIIAGAKNKVDKLIEVIEPYKKENKILVYCGAVNYDMNDDNSSDRKQISEVVERLSKDLDMCVSKFTAEEDSKERKNILDEFKKEFNPTIQALVAIKCLDEGVNIPTIKTAFILASSSNPKEYIQRLGRVLRKHPGKKYAEIYDFVTLSRPFNVLQRMSKEEKDLEISLAEKELERIEYFATLSDNSSNSNDIKDKIKEAYNINKIAYY